MKKLISLIAVLFTFTSSVLLGVNDNSKTVKAVTSSTTIALTKDNGISDQARSNKLAQAVKATAKLRGRNKKIASTSVVQLKQWLTNKNFADIPLLLIGSI